MFFGPDVMLQLQQMNCAIEKHDLRTHNPGVEDEFVILVRKYSASDTKLVLL